MSEWVPVTERMPEKAFENNQFYITETVYAIAFGFRYIGYFKVWKYDESSAFYGIDVDELAHGECGETLSAGDVTHWMPLPGPPEVTDE